jgi:ABC-type transporter Mla MlaB component
MVDEAGASECTRILEAARKAKRRLQVSGVDRLIALLKDLNRATHSRPAHWLFLLELYQTLGQEEAFRGSGGRLRSAFRGFAPVVDRGPGRRGGPGSNRAGSAESEIEMLALAGEITPATESTLQKFSDYAASHDPVVVDLAQVTRVDYASVSKLISTLMQCLGSGKTITLRGHNALIHELFRVMGIDQLTQLSSAPPRLNTESHV